VVKSSTKVQAVIDFLRRYPRKAGWSVAELKERLNTRKHVVVNSDTIYRAFHHPGGYITRTGEWQNAYVYRFVGGNSSSRGGKKVAAAARRAGTCELCSRKHDGSFGSGRFCSEACAKGFSSSHQSVSQGSRRQTTKAKQAAAKRVCELCSAKHSGSFGSGRFCSDACAKAWSSRHRRGSRAKPDSDSTSSSSSSSSEEEEEEEEEDRGRQGQRAGSHNGTATVELSVQRQLINFLRDHDRARGWTFAEICEAFTP
jgi:hypothetical protein